MWHFTLLCTVAHHIFGVAHTINSANYVYFLGLEKALSLNNPDVTKVFTGKLIINEKKTKKDLILRMKERIHLKLFAYCECLVIYL